MVSKSRINIVSKRSSEISDNITVENNTYLVHTEDTGGKTCRIISRVYLKGEIVFSKKSDYLHLKKLKDFNDKLSELMVKQHKSTIDIFLFEQSKKQKLKSEYFKEVKYLLRTGDGRSALNTLREGLEKYPADPFLMSYYGYLLSVVDKNPREGIKKCRDAIVALDKAMPFASEFYYPVFYLNLGRTYLKENRIEAINCFRTGLKTDPENQDLLNELNKLGSRRKPAMPFLNRSNPINKYIGMVLSKASI
jgi:tetratricopeptide (TPR) repeat protein